MRLLVLAAIATASPASAKPCNMRPLGPAVLTAADTAIPSDGGVVVGVKSVDSDLPGGGDPAVQPSWRVRAGAQLVAPKIDSIAPGLAVYRLPADATELEDATHAVVFTAKRTASPVARLRAPKIRRIAHTEYRRGRRSSTRVTVELAAARPASAVALVIVDAKTKQPYSWGAATDSPIEVYADGTCIEQPDGFEPAPKRARVRAFWVDAAGRVSPPTAPIVVR